MNEQFGPLFDKIGELMQYAYNIEDKPISKEKQAELTAQLKVLEEQVKSFKKNNNKLLQRIGVNDDTYKKMLEDEKSGIIDPDQRALLKRAQSLKVEAEAASQDYLKAAANAKAEGKQLDEKEKEPKQKSPQARKGKFRGMGGFKNWKPM